MTEINILNKLTPYIADSDLGPDTGLFIKGFSNRQEIEFFMERLYSVSFVKGPDNVEKIEDKP